jgi:nuclear transport factor 2 (NTF2) superfamily protein
MTVTIFKPPFTLETAIAKVKAAEDALNTRDLKQISLATRLILNGAIRTSVKFRHRKDR